MLLSDALAGLGGVSLGAIWASAMMQTTIGPDSVVNLGTVVGICGGILWLNVTLSKIQNRLKSIEAGRGETWTYNMQRAYALDFQNKNRELNVPIPPEKVSTA